ncbi:hypothetical protein M91_07993, partial [Bos mutus]
NVRSMNQGKLKVVKQEMARVNVDILGISELKWTGMGEFNSDDHYIYYCEQESLRRNGMAIMVNKRVRNGELGCNLKNDRMISVHLQGKPFNITVVEVYASTSNAEEAEVERFYEDLQDLLELTPPKNVLFIIGDWDAKVGSQETPEVTGKFGLGIQNEAGQRLIEADCGSDQEFLIAKFRLKLKKVGKTIRPFRGLFKKIRDTKGTFHAKMGSIKDR